MERANAINLFHVVGVSSIMGYMAYSNYQGSVVGPNYALMVILLLFVMVFYHAWRLYDRSLTSPPTVQNDDNKPLPESQ